MLKMKNRIDIEILKWMLNVIYNDRFRWTDANVDWLRDTGNKWYRPYHTSFTSLALNLKAIWIMFSVSISIYKLTYKERIED